MRRRPQARQQSVEDFDGVLGQIDSGEQPHANLLAYRTFSPFPPYFQHRSY